jgi:CRP/FNR family transcriptional regulator
VGELLYTEGQRRTHVYRIEKGVVAVFERRLTKPVKVIDLASRGQFIGLGCLEHHRDNARAVVASRVAVVPRMDFAQLCDRNSALEEQQRKAVERDFECGKALADDRGRASPLESVAALLVAVSRRNAHEGGNPNIIRDSFECGTVASLLALDLGSLAGALCELHDLGLIEHGPASDLHLLNVEAIECIADGEAADAVLTRMPIVSCRFASATNGAQSLAERPTVGSSWMRSSWAGELREVAWLISMVGSLSVVSVAIAVLIALGLP